MTHLIALIIAISLGAIYFFGFSTSINEEPHIIEKNKNEILSNFALLTQGKTSHQMYTMTRLNALSWQSQLSEQIRLPLPIYEMNWDYGVSATGEYFCLTGNTSRTLLISAMIKIRDGYNNVYLNEDCGANTNFVTMPSLGSKLSLTYYVN